ncbi:MAG: hypothetical protein F7C81_04500 [Desulfurococcales archaeon]|nr:hypothetical protein [Desulfurococcales archaeon]
MSLRGWSRKYSVVRLKGPLRGIKGLEKLYNSYYRLNPPLGLPPDMERREFAFHPFNLDSYVRHLSFSSEEELRSYMIENTPRHAYYSIALYELPEAKDMDSKVWLGSELLFDIDIDPRTCGASIIVDDECITKAYEKARLIVEILKRDFGADATVYFTGNRGFHVKASCSYCLKLGREERREIASYIRGEGLRIDAIIPRGLRVGKRRLDPASPTPDDPGWRGWITVLLKLEPEKSIVEMLGRNWLERIEVELAKHRPDIDMQVTQDPSRLARITGTLNGKSSLLVVDATYGLDLDPRRLSPFRGEVKVRPLADIDDTTLLGFEFKLKKGVVEELPAWLAIHLATRELVELVEGEVVVRADTGWRGLQGSGRASRVS